MKVRESRGGGGGVREGGEARGEGGGAGSTTAEKNDRAPEHLEKYLSLGFGFDFCSKKKPRNPTILPEFEAFFTAGHSSWRCSCVYYFLSFLLSESSSVYCSTGNRGGHFLTPRLWVRALFPQDVVGVEPFCQHAPSLFSGTQSGEQEENNAENSANPGIGSDRTEQWGVAL